MTLPRPRAHPLARALAAVTLAAIASACDAADDREPTQSASSGGTHAAEASPSAAPDPTASASAGGEETSVFDLELHDCFTANGDQIETVTVVDCEAQHVYEVFAIFDHEAGADEPYPGDDVLLEYADAACQPYFEDYVGADYETSIYWITSVTPSQQTWQERDDREIVCTLKLGETGEATTGSAEGSGQ